MESQFGGGASWSSVQVAVHNHCTALQRGNDGGFVGTGHNVTSHELPGNKFYFSVLKTEQINTGADQSTSSMTSIHQSGHFIVDPACCSGELPNEQTPPPTRVFAREDLKVPASTGP